MFQKWCEIGLGLLLITNRKLYTGFRLAPKSMTLDDLEHQNRGFCGFFCRFCAAKQTSRANCAAISRDRQGQASDKIFTITKEWYPRKSRYFAAVCQCFMKAVADRHGHAAYRNKH